MGSRVWLDVHKTTKMIRRNCSHASQNDLTCFRMSTKSPRLLGQDSIPPRPVEHPDYLHCAQWKNPGLCGHTYSGANNFTSVMLIWDLFIFICDLDITELSILTKEITLGLFWLSPSSWALSPDPRWNLSILAFHPLIFCPLNPYQSA